MARSLSENGLDDCTFVRTVKVRGGEVSVPLIAGGGGVVVTEDNKREWLEKLLQSELVDGCAEAASHFRKGFLDVVGMPNVDSSDPYLSRWTTPHLFLLSAAELQRAFSGAPVTSACVDELRRVAEVHPEVETQSEWLWEIMISVTDEKRAKYYRYLTGSSRRPSAGFPDFRIGPKEGGDGAYPFAHTCGNSVDMPSYSSREVLLARLEVAVEAAHDTFTDF